MSTINLTAHGLTAGQRVVFSNIVPSGTGVLPDVVYTVLATGLTANAFQISETANEADPLTLLLNITSATMAVVPETTDTDTETPSYTPISDVNDVQAPPTTPPVPPVPTLQSNQVAGITRLRVIMSVTAEVKLRAFEVQITNKYADNIAIAGTVTGVAATDIITLAAHGLVAGDKVRFTALTGGAGLTTISPDYFVIATNLTANTFMVSLTSGGAAFDFTTDISTGSASKVVTTYADWTTPTIFNLPEGSTEVSMPCLGSTNYTVRVRSWDVYGQPSGFCAESQITSAAGNDALNSAIANLANDVQDYSITETKIADLAISTPKLRAGSVTAQVLAATIVLSSLIKTIPTTRMGADLALTGVAATDIFTLAAHGLAVNDRVRFSSLTGGAGLTVDAVDYFVIATNLTATTFQVSGTLGGSAVNFTTDVTAGTVNKVIRRVEIDTAGVRLLDTDDSLIVNIPTNGDPVYFRGKIDADTITVQTSTTMRGAISHDSSSVDTLQNGVATPGSSPSLVASVDSLTLTSSPSNPQPGIAYDSAAGTFWVACNPTVSPYYVAQEFNATTGALVRSIPASGSITTVTAISGSTSHISDTADGLVGSTDSHINTPMTIPTILGASNYKVTKVAVWMAGRSGTCATRNGIWTNSSATPNCLGTSAQYTAASGGATTLGASDLHNQTLSSPVAVTPGTTYRFGFYRTNTSDGSQHDKDDGSGKTTYSGDGTTADGTGWGTRDTAGKPNVYFTYTYDVDTRKETAAMIGVAVDPVGGFIYTLDTNGVVWKYDRTTLAWAANSAVQTAITGTKANAGMFWDATASELIITTTTGTGAGVRMRAVRVATTLAVSSTVYDDATGPTFSGTADTFRGGARAADALGSANTYWFATTSAVYAFTFATTVLTNVANRDFGQAATIGSGLTWDGTQFRGWATATPTKVWKFSAWDWTTASAVYWIGYSWYDSNATGGVHETNLGPRASITMRRRERVQIGNATIPVGGADDPNNVRIYTLPGAADFAAGSGKLQITDALTSRYMTNYNAAGAADCVAGVPTANFSAGTPAQLKSAATGWNLKGSGVMVLGGTTFPAAPADGDTFWRSDLNMRFQYKAGGVNKWLSDPFTVSMQARNNASISATTNGVERLGNPAALAGATQVYVWKANVAMNASVIQSATIFWAAALAWINSSTGASTTLGTVDTKTQTTASRWKNYQITVGALSDANVGDWEMNYTLTGVGGTLHSVTTLLMSYAL